VRSEKTFQLPGKCLIVLVFSLFSSFFALRLTGAMKTDEKSSPSKVESTEGSATSRSKDEKSQEEPRPSTSGTSANSTESSATTEDPTVKDDLFEVAKSILKLVQLTKTLNTRIPAHS
jgi:hypothetical protein